MSGGGEWWGGGVGGGGGGGGALGAGQAGALTPGALSLRKWMACADVYKKARAMYGTLP